jgi:hypothetical protein
MKRREFFSLVGGAAVACSTGTAKRPRIGYAYTLE